MDFNSKCVKLEMDIVNIINSADLPIGVVVYVLHTVLASAEKSLNVACSQPEEVLEENNNGTE